MKLILLGAPGAGKGTQAKLVSEKLNIKHISTGDLLRQELETDSSISKSIEAVMKSGKYVDDSIVRQLLVNELKKDECANGFVLDGYPRNLDQAKGLFDIIDSIDKVIIIHVDDDVIVSRMSGRLVCPNCGQVYHKDFNPPKNGLSCEKCGEEVVQRDDDKPEVVKRRLDIYHDVTTPIIKYYEDLGISATVSGLGNISEITKEIIEAIEKR